MYFEKRTTSSNFNKSLFRFLLRRLGSAGDNSALDHALGLLKERPEETDAILSYVTALGEITRADGEIVGYINHDEAIYPYQAYQILKWRLCQSEPPSGHLLQLIRRFALQGDSPTYLCAEARAALGKWGSPADLEALMHAYGNATNDVERAEIICSIAKMETGRRNGFLGQVAGDSELCSRAARLVRGGNEAVR